MRIKVLLIIFILAYSTKICFSQPVYNEDKIAEAFKVLEEASMNGGDVSHLVPVLNDIILEINSGHYDVEIVEAKLDLVINNAERVNAEALIESRNNLIFVGITVFLVVLLEILVWKFFPRLFWNIWLRKRGDWILR